MVLTEQQLANVGPRELKEPGSLAWCWQTVGLLQNMWRSVDRNVERYDEVWESLVEHRAWEKIPQEQPFGTIEVMKEKLSVGSPDEARALVARLAVQAKPLAKHDTNQPTSGAEYLAARIARDHPEIHERMQLGEFKSVAEAARAAGILKMPTKRVALLKDVDRVAHNIKNYYTPEQVQALKKAL